MGVGASKKTNSRLERYISNIMFVTSILEQSAVVWHSSLTVENCEDLERVEKTAVKIILKDNYKTYENGLARLGLETLKDRREQAGAELGQAQPKLGLEDGFDV